LKIEFSEGSLLDSGSGLGNILGPLPLDFWKGGGKKERKKE
jgi:hypothetical protein